MIVKECKLTHSKFMEDYIAEKPQLQSFFDYNYKNDHHYIERYRELMDRKFQRKELANYLLRFNRKYDCSSETIINIEKLTNDHAVVVVGGQQAGVLTGPLYTIYKIITILKLAKAQEEKLQVPVVPIFWIAGEDHDFAEINHIYSTQSGTLHKRKVNQLNNNRCSVSDLILDKLALRKFVNEVLLDNKETSHTQALAAELNKVIENSNTYIDFFGFLIHKLFKDSGIVLLDSHSQELRKLEISFLKQIVTKNETLHEKFLESAHSLFENGYGEPIECRACNAHLFYHLNGTRILLERTETDFFSDKQKTFLFSSEELGALIEKEPENFSNNVVTRPIMQEFLLPVLAFVAGPGEVAYWATLKEAFHLFGYKLPPIVPRLAMTFIEPKINKWLKNGNLIVPEIINHGTAYAREKSAYWAEERRIDETFSSAFMEIEKVHLPLIDLVTCYDKGLKKLAEKNIEIIKKEINFLTEKLTKSVRQKYENEWIKFDIIDATIRPNGGLQERSLNIVTYINYYGFDFVKQVLDLSIDLNDYHKLIFLR